MRRTKTGPTVPWPSLEQCTSLGKMLLEWMWAQRPPMPVALLASRVGVDRSTLFGWLTTDRQPQPLQLLLLAQATSLPITDMASAANVPLERVQRQHDVVFDYVTWEVKRAAGDSVAAEDEREALLERLGAVRATWPPVESETQERDGMDA
jgi:hypothetical protein